MGKRTAFLSHMTDPYMLCGRKLSDVCARTLLLCGGGWKKKELFPPG